MKILIVFLFIFYTTLLIGQGSDSIICIKCKHHHSSPYNFSFKKEIPFVLTGVGIIASAELIKHENNTQPFTEDELLLLDRNDVNAFDRPSTDKYNTEAARASDILRSGVVIFPVLFLFNHHTRKDIKGLALLTVEVVGINWGVTNGVKNIFNRTRPYVYNDNVSLDERTNDQSRLSFFSGHSSHTAAVSFLFAKVINDYHPDMDLKYKFGLWGVATLIPATTAYLRVQSGDHFPTDVMVGCGLGAAIGWLVPHLHKRKTNIGVSSFSFKDANGFSLSYKF